MLYEWMNEIWAAREIFCDSVSRICHSNSEKSDIQAFFIAQNILEFLAMFSFERIWLDLPHNDDCC